MMHIWRVSIKIDWTASLFLVEPPILPQIPAAEDLHRQWIMKSAFATDADWALTAFSLDNLIHKVRRPVCRYPPVFPLICRFSFGYRGVVYLHLI